MAQQDVKITFSIDGIQNSVASVDELQSALKGVETQAGKTESAIEGTVAELKKAGDAATETGEAGEGALSVIDEATGGLGSRVAAIGKGLKQMGGAAKTAFNGAIAGASGMKKALISTGIGALVVALGLIVAYWDDIKGLVSGVSQEGKANLKITQDTVVAAQDQLSATEGSESSLKLAGASEKEIRDLKIQQTEEIITATELLLTQQAEIKSSQIAAAERNQKITAGIIGFLSAPITLLLTAIDALTYGLAKLGVIEDATNLVEGFVMGTASLLFDPADAAKEGQDTIDATEKTLKALKNKRAGFILTGKAANKKESDDKIANEKALNAELERLRAENIVGEEAKALALLEIERKKQAEALKLAGASKELLLELDKNYLTQKAAIEEKFRLEREAKEAEEKKIADDNRKIVDDVLQQAGLDQIDDTVARALAELTIQREADIEKVTTAGATAEEIAKINAAYDKKEKKLGDDKLKFDKALKRQEVDQALNAGADVLDSIVSLVGEGSSVGKAAAIASATIQTYTAAQAAYASVVGIPVVGPVLAPIAAGIAVASGILNVKKILATKIPGGGDAGGQVPSVPTFPSFNPTAAASSASGDNTVPADVTLNGTTGSSTIIRAYVVDTEVTSQQEATRKIENLASL